MAWYDREIAKTVVESVGDVQNEELRNKMIEIGRDAVDRDAQENS